MGAEDWSKADDLTWIERLARAPGSFDFHVALRRFEATFAAMPRLGEAARPSDETIRIGQTPSSAFAPTAVSAFAPGLDGGVARLFESFLGVWGPHGPLPGHLTEYARDRSRHYGDETLTRFLDVFHHRIALVFHRAWAKTQPTCAMDRPLSDRFADYVGAFLGLGLPSTRNRDSFPDRAKLFYVGRLACAPRNAEGLRDVIADYFGVRAAIEEFVGEWIQLPTDGRWQLGVAPETGTLGRTAVLGARVWSRTHKFRVVLGPLSREDFERTLPTSATLATLSALVRLYTNDQWDWDVRLVLHEDAMDSMRLGRGARLGWTTRIGPSRGAREDLLVDPTLGRTRRVPATSAAT